MREFPSRKSGCDRRRIADLQWHLHSRRFALKISVPSAVQLRLALRRLSREHGVTAPAHRGNHGAGAAAPYPMPFCL